MAQKNSYAASRKVPAYRYLRDVSVVLFSEIQVEKDEKKLRAKSIAIILFSAFTLEAFLNHIGESIFQERWVDEGLEWLDPNKKLKHVCSEIGLAVNYTEDPFKSFSWIFDFRDRLVHGRTYQARKEKKLKPKDDASIEEIAGELEPTAEWERLAKRSKVDEAFHNTKRMIQEIWQAAGVEEGKPIPPVETQVYQDDRYLGSIYEGPSSDDPNIKIY